MHFRHPLLLTILLAAAPLSQAITIRDDVGDDGAPGSTPPLGALELAAEAAYASVGKLNRSGDITSGVLIDPYFVLTAAHVVLNAPANGFIFTIGNFDYTSAGYTASGVDDLAIIQLASPVLNVTPALLYTGSAEVGQLATLVGFGEGGLGSTGATTARGTKRAATNLISATQDVGLGTTTGRMLLYDFDSGIPQHSYFSPFTQTSQEGMIAAGDSGGGTFATINSLSYLIGIHAGVWSDGDGFAADYGDAGGDVRVSTASPFIQSVVPEPSSIACLGSGLALLGMRRNRKR